MQSDVLTRVERGGEEEASARGVLFYRGVVDQVGETRGSMKAGEVAGCRRGPEAVYAFRPGAGRLGRERWRRGPESGKIGSQQALEILRPSGVIFSSAYAEEPASRSLGSLR